MSKLSITHYYREPRKTGLSIEGIFKLVKEQLAGRADIRDFFCDPQLSRSQNTKRAGAYASDINHITGDVNFLALGLKGRKNILTIHDLGHYSTLKARSSLKAFIYSIFWFRLPLRHISIVTVISEFTKTQFLTNFKFPQERIRVIYDPVKPVFRYAAKSRLSDVPVILQVGSGVHKNLGNLIESVRGMKVHIDIVAWVDEQTEQKLKEYNISYTIYNGLSDEELHNRYAACDILYFASFYEGFGMPIIEAQSVGRPVITSNYGAMKEVAGNSALLVDPASVNGIRQAIQSLLQNRTLYNELVAKGKENIVKFGAEKIANDYLAVYKELHSVK